MKRKLLAAALLMALAGKAHAAVDFIDTAPVVSSTPIVERVSEPRQECGPAPAAAPAQPCRTVKVEREVIRGYTVVYRYNGRDVTVTLPHDPGPTVRVGVGVGIVDNAPAVPAPSAGSLGSNVRDVTPAPAHEPATPPAGTGGKGGAGGYQYRY